MGLQSGGGRRAEFSLSNLSPGQQRDVLTSPSVTMLKFRRMKEDGENKVFQTSGHT